MPISIIPPLGIGTKYFGASARDDDGSFITTEWFTFAFLPIFPIGSFRVTYIGVEPNGIDTNNVFEKHYKVDLNRGQIFNTLIKFYGSLLLMLICSIIASGILFTSNVENIFLIGIVLLIALIPGAYLLNSFSSETVKIKKPNIKFQGYETNQKSKSWAAFAHFANIFFPIGIIITWSILKMRGNKYDFVHNQSIEAINFFITLCIFYTLLILITSIPYPLILGPLVIYLIYRILLHSLKISPTIAETLDGYYRFKKFFLIFIIITSILASIEPCYVIFLALPIATFQFVWFLFATNAATYGKEYKYYINFRILN